MTPFRVFLHRLRGLFFKRKVDRDLDDELRFHIEMQVEENLRAGMAPEKAHQTALREFGGVTQIKESYRDGRTLQTVETAMQDMRYGLRMLWKTPGWSAVMGATLALGVGLSTSIFSLAYNVLLRALPYPDPDRLVAISLSREMGGSGVVRYNVNARNWMAWREKSTSFDDIAITRATLNFNLSGEGSPERLIGAQASPNLTRVLGVQPRLGRMFTEEESLQNAKLTILSYGFWERRYSSDPGVIGRKILLNDESFEVIGIMPPGFRYPTGDFDLWIPLFISPVERSSQTSWYYKAVGRLKAGVSLPTAQAELSGVTRQFAEHFRALKDSGQESASVESLLDNAVGKFRTSLYVLLAAVGCLLALGCINLSGLLIVRASVRTHEFAVRAALGARPARLRSQTLAETLPLSAFGAGGGALLAWGLLIVLKTFLPPTLPDIESIGVNSASLEVALGLSLAVVLIAGMLPARMVSRVQLTGAVKQDSRAGGGAMRNALVISQVAVTLMLIFAGLLLMRSLVAVWQVNSGFSPRNLLTLKMEASPAKYPDAAEIGDYYQRIVARVKTIPGVIEAGVTGALPYSGCCISGGAEFSEKITEGQFSATFVWTTPGYFAAMGIPLLQGRDFTRYDKEGATPVGIIDEQLALKVFGDKNPLGKRFRFGVITESTPWIEVVGVVGHIRAYTLEKDSPSHIYWPGAQWRAETKFPQSLGALVVKTSGKPASFAPAIVKEIQKENPDQPVYDVRTMEDWIDRSLQSRNLLTGLVSLLVGSALLLACLGLYGVVSYGARLRLREFAIRSALGALPGDLRRLVLSHAARLWIIGSSIGLAATWPIGQAMKSQLFGVGSADGVSLALAPALLLVIALLAALGPALKAGKVDPAATLRSD